MVIEINVVEDALKSKFYKIYFWSQKGTCRKGSASTDLPVPLSEPPLAAWQLPGGEGCEN
jgi:hypothetical protein